MSIAAIIEKYNVERCISAYPTHVIVDVKAVFPVDFPALTAELETLMREEACEFAAFVHMADKPAIVEDLYRQFKNQTK